VRNTVITGWDFSGYPGYPAAWPGATSLKAYYWDGSVFDPPFYLQNYLGASCKDGQGQYIGIKLDSVGADTSNAHIYPGVALPQYFSDIVIGDTTNTGSSNKYSNLLDNLEYGIYGLNSNMTVVNSAFTNIYNVKGPTYPYGDTIIGGNAIYAYAMNDVVNHNRLRVYAPEGGGYHNRFYGFTTAIACYNYVQVIGLYNTMINAGTGSSVFSISHGPTGAFGYLVQSAKYDSINISYDTISNVNTGISFWALQDPQGIPFYPEPAAPWQYSGSLNISYNLIQASPLGYSTTMTQLLSMGISVQNILSQSGTVPVHGSGYAGKMNVNGNYLYDVYDGIYVNNFARQQAVTSANTITLRAYPQHRLQYGINHTLCRNSQMYYNLISGDVPTVAANDSVRAFYASSNTGIGIACNTETGVGRGYEFYLKNPGTAWHDNSMNNNGKGMILNGGIIGTQHYGGYPMNNQWLGSWGAGDTQTYVYNGANAINDTLLVAPGGTTEPTLNSGSPGGIRFDYLIGTSIQVYSGIMREHPPFCGGWIDYETAPQNQGINLYQQITQEQILYPGDVIPNNWIGQFAIWQNIVADTTLLDSSTVLAVFASLAQNSRFAYLTDMETQLAEGNFDSVETMLTFPIDSMANTSTDSVSQVKMADGPGADFIVQNYQQFYSLYIKYMQDTLNGSDSLGIQALASLCPEINGTVVYQARALYSLVFNDLSVFNDDSCMDVDSTYSAERHSNAQGGGNAVQSNNGQVYKLFPNPNNGSFTISQSTLDIQPVHAAIFDVVGRNIYEQNLLFNNGTDNLRLNTFVPGVYLLKLKDAEGREFRFKFVIE
jgi:hypothetical protein